MDINIARTKEVEKQLKRIADCLEVYILETFHIRMTATPPPDKDESDVLYDSEEKHEIQRLRDLGEYRKPDAVVDVEDYKD